VSASALGEDNWGASWDPLPNDLSSHFGHDKSFEIRQYAKLPENKRPTMFYAGDGVSDLSAAKETNLLFAKKGQGKKPFYLQNMRPSNEF
jgi:2-hydroxy-3-keto-5-methylthiopentenyl-1-phosphate phosphatase